MFTIFQHLQWYYLDAMDFHAVGTLPWRDAVFHFNPWQKVPPQRSIKGLQHAHVHAIGCKADLGDHKKIK